MKNVLKHPFLKLIRFNNLLIVAATQYLILYCIIKPLINTEYSPLFKRYNISLKLQFSDLDFLFLVLATVLITAAGYVINDYFDRKTDLHNRPDKVIIGTHISSRTAMTLHWLFNIVGVLLGFYVSYKIDMYSLGMVYVFITGLLWFYSTTFSKELLIGNVIIALLSALVPLLVAVYEIIPLNKVYVIHMRSIDLYFNKIIFWTLGYSFFAFFISLIREIIKDMEDLEGDNAYGRNTIPIAIGMNYTKTIVIALIIGVVFLIYFATYVYITDLIHDILIPVSYFSVFIVAPLIYAAVKIATAQKTKDYTIASALVKISMVGGILFLIILGLIINGTI